MQMSIKCEVHPADRGAVADCMKSVREVTVHCLEQSPYLGSADHAGGDGQRWRSHVQTRPSGECAYHAEAHPGSLRP